MTAASDYLEIAVIDHIFKNSAMSQPTNIYVALCKSTITDSHTGSTLPSEVSGGAYARKQCNTWDAADAAGTANTGAITFAQATADWGVVTDFAVCDHLSTGHVFCYGKLTASKTVSSGDTIEFAAGALTVALS